MMKRLENSEVVQKLLHLKLRNLMQGTSKR